MITTKTIFTILATTIITALIVYLLMKPKKTVDVPDGVRSLTSICMDYDTVTPPTLTSKMAQAMVAKYGSTQLNNIQTAPSNAVPKDAKSIWFDLETLKQFLYRVEISAKKNDSLKRNLGVRIYYAAYPKNDEMKRLAQDQTDPNFTMNSDYENLHTLVMIPTISDREGNNYDFNPLDAATYDGFTRMDKEKSSPMTNGNYSILSLGTSGPQTAAGNSIIARNRGELSPPAYSNGISF
ncbi:MAG: hypothetical protein H7174_01135 [Flavobacterium sp.]|nr:hypothetical protein [Flavobacterium sp.]